MDKESRNKAESKMQSITKSGESKDGCTFYTRLNLPKCSVPETLRVYWSSSIHRAQIELMGRILRG